ncbi:TadE/TadG family type IV pilus assembly protein [Acinetobacter venetianus]|uniref:TadE/TadG family type IV pilus assembly protein n=1 Tax=Acinetobacter venetianus TaxID=52133 RepID=UPI003A9572C3
MNISRPRSYKGVAAIEFTIVLPFLLLLLAAIAEFGNAFIKYNILNKAVQNGARIAVTEVYGTAKAEAIASDEEITNAVLYGHTNDPDTNAGESPVLDAVIVTVEYEPGDDYVVVTGSYPYQPLLGVLLGGLLTDIKLTSSSVMRVEP